MVHEQEGLTIKEASGILGLSERTVRRWIHQGKLDAELVNTPFGAQYFIKSVQVEEVPKADKGSRRPPLDIVQILQKEIRDLKERNEQLAILLGGALKDVESWQSKYKELAEYKPQRVPWWRRITGRG